MRGWEVRMEDGTERRPSRIEAEALYRAASAQIGRQRTAASIPQGVEGSQRAGHPSAGW